MNTETILRTATGFLPAAWGMELRLGAVFAALLGSALVLVFAVRLAFGQRRAAPGRLAAEPVRPDILPGVDFNPDEWVSGAVVHYDRHKAFGFIRCDRMKAPVRFEMPALPSGRMSAPRIGEKVRFKGRHGARRKPVAICVEPVLKASQAT